MTTVPINECELQFIELFRVALSAPTHGERLSAIRCVKHDVIGSRLEKINEVFGSDWTEHKDNQELVKWIAATAGAREEAIHHFTRVCRDYEQKYERRLNVAEQIGKMIYLSIADGKSEGVQTPGGILYQVSIQGREHGVRGAKDIDTLRKAWRTYRGVAHLGMAIDQCEELAAPLGNVIPVAEKFRKILSESYPKGTTDPYVAPEQQISFLYESSIKGPRFLNRGLPFYIAK